MRTEDYDAMFDEVRAAILTDPAYSIALAKEGNKMVTRTAATEARRAAKAARPESNTDLQ